jgi:predicted nucleotidyltransferase component of viral defense system
MDRISDEQGPAPSEEYRELYILQDKVLQTVFSIESEFYLTGGTCLSRFYKAGRYSDDLDFFTNDSARFSYAMRNIRNALLEKCRLSIEVETKNFQRLRVDGRLQIDFVNDGPFRCKDPVVTGENYIIDTVENILANKLTAVIGRDDAKDVFDIILIHTHYSVLWDEILDAAHKKAGFSNEDLIIRLKSFPIELFNRIKCIDCGFLENYEKALDEIISAILEA